MREGGVCVDLQTGARGGGGGGGIVRPIQGSLLGEDYPSRTPAGLLPTSWCPTRRLSLRLTICDRKVPVVWATDKPFPSCAFRADRRVHVPTES